MVTVTTRHSRRRNRQPTVMQPTPGSADAPVKLDSIAGSHFSEPERRHAMICDAAYFLAERRGFCPGRELDDWLAAETEIDRALTSGDPGNRRGG